MIVVSFVFLYLGVHGFLHFSKTTTFLFDEKVSATHDFQEFQQKLDHFDSSSNDSFTQRYVVNTDMYNNSHVLIVYIGGEGSLGTSSVERGFHFYLAQTYGAVLAALEHRYYGKSQPYQDLSVEHLKYLSSYQALDDLAYFITYLKGIMFIFNLLLANFRKISRT
jgi:serine protease 16